MSTLNSFEATGKHNIPAHFKSNFRVIALMEPDLEQVLRAKCIRYGIRAPNILAARLKTLYELYEDTFGQQQQQSQNRSPLTVSCLISVLRMIYARQHATTSGGNEESADSRTTSSVANHSANKYGTAKNERIYLSINSKKLKIFVH